MMKIQAQTQAKQAEMQLSAQIEQQKLQAQMQAEQAKQQAQAQENALRNQLEHERQQADREMEMKLAQMKMLTERNTQLLLAYINNGAKVEVARIGKSVDDGTVALDQYQSDADILQAQEHPLAPIANAISQSNQQMTDTIGQLISTLQNQHAMANRPKQVIRDEQGKIVGVQ
jgi:multidrug efflux pump subunit AcrA (membrane-fusion protein)